MSDEQFREIVKKSIEYIKAGDVFQVVPSRRISFEIDVDPFHIYRALRVVNPSPYMYFLKMEDVQLIGSSPEILLKAKNRIMNLRPIAGTRPRGATEVEDEELVKDMGTLPIHVRLRKSYAQCRLFHCVALRAGSKYSGRRAVAVR